jgi:poly(U)-specific endoribonuclease
MEVPEEMSIASLRLDASLEKVVQHLWDLDVNRFQQGTNYVLNVQGGKKPYQKRDAANNPLFVSVDQRQLQSRPTFRTFYALLDNCVAQTGVAKNVIDMKCHEIKAFVHAIVETALIQFCHKYCRANDDNIPSDKERFMKLLHSIWFQLYRRSRGGREDSSSFEHVFIVEVKGNKVSKLYMEEKKGALGYRCYIKPHSNGDTVTNDDDSI